MGPPPPSVSRPHCPWVGASHGGPASEASHGTSAGDTVEDRDLEGLGSVYVDDLEGLFVYEGLTETFLVLIPLEGLLPPPECPWGSVAVGAGALPRAVATEPLAFAGPLAGGPRTAGMRRSRRALVSSTPQHTDVSLMLP